MVDCLLCDDECVYTKSFNRKLVLYDCPSCGEYGVSYRPADRLPELSSEQRGLIAAHLSEMRQQDSKGITLYGSAGTDRRVLPGVNVVWWAVEREDGP